MKQRSSVHTPPLSRLALVVALALLLAPSAYAHLELVRTAPEADATVHGSPTEIRLWFTEGPQIRGTSVRLVDGGGNLVATTDAAADPQDEKQVFIRPEASLGRGSYTVQWRTMAQDGHAMNGAFTFQVHAE